MSWNVLSGTLKCWLSFDLKTTGEVAPEDINENAQYVEESIESVFLAQHAPWRWSRFSLVRPDDMPEVVTWVGDAEWASFVGNPILLKTGNAFNTVGDLGLRPLLNTEWLPKVLGRLVERLESITGDRLDVDRLIDADAVDTLEIIQPRCDRYLMEYDDELTIIRSWVGVRDGVEILRYEVSNVSVLK